MFSNQKKSFFKSKWFYGIIAAALLAFGVWVNYDGSSQKANTATEVDQQTQSTTQSPAVVDSRDDETSDETDEETTDESETTQTEETQQTYFLIREIEGVVKVFYCNENGEESLYQITTIPFALLSKEDQQMLAEGLQVNSKDELADFLQNFDS
ncbi:BofC C-terminal domain-containing protein [Anaerovorax odorimutans]|uniref:BofC C-terminal domain-containing protein n=1 Tax=Anaerovorax odorimutans TaxID=109327 RepID=A0ABT1RLL4_9FIRM|nr:BofC C-terminal domain-containing protein [Anaerovorax odorimutans]MCQ4635831.1 BofC C-terminal domain-containing protein [Anaerovorax odorimutans]